MTSDRDASHTIYCEQRFSCSSLSTVRHPLDVIMVLHWLSSCRYAQISQDLTTNIVTSLPFVPEVSPQKLAIVI